MTYKVKAYAIRNSSETELLAQIRDTKTELAQLRVAQVTGGAPAKLASICTARKNIARVLTVFNQKRKEESKKAFEGKKFKPLDQRARKTRALSRVLSTAQQNKTTLKEKTRNDNFPMRRYAVAA